MCSSHYAPHAYNIYANTVIHLTLKIHIFSVQYIWWNIDFKIRHSVSAIRSIIWKKLDQKVKLILIFDFSKLSKPMSISCLAEGCAYNAHSSRTSRFVISSFWVSIRYLEVAFQWFNAKSQGSLLSFNQSILSCRFALSTSGTNKFI